MRLLEDRILVKRDKAETQSAGGIVLPSSSQEKPNHGTVVAVGPGRRHSTDSGSYNILMSVAVGDKIVFSKYNGFDLEDDEGQMVIRESDVLMILDE